MGETEDTSTYESNLVTLTFSSSAAAAGSDDASGTLQVHQDNFALYNINVKNTVCKLIVYSSTISVVDIYDGSFGEGSQALALSAWGTNQGYYASAFFGFQDTLLAETGNQYYGFCYIEGAVDFIFGQHAFAFFQKNTIASVGLVQLLLTVLRSKGMVYEIVINESTIEQAADAPTSLTEQVFLGRPWTEFATVAFTSCSLSSVINPAGWEIWEPTEPNTGDVTFAEFENTGAGAAGTRASFATKATSDAPYNVGVVLGADWATWVDQSYV
ncbi:pectin lyase fold/virulence factor [Rhodocollybia butyracea]|uniref:Pectinesterase n=1 Tax=Rhodocollybia butyracea TaxID=206335 RepID=A0A9P5PEH6_9AGAR|nr:pectin lyase fold/virulence factor [Rhodocollybia butyracea]